MDIQVDQKEENNITRLSNINGDVEVVSNDGEVVGLEPRRNGFVLKYGNINYIIRDGSMYRVKVVGS